VCLNDVDVLATGVQLVKYRDIKDPDPQRATASSRKAPFFSSAILQHRVKNVNPFLAVIAGDPNRDYLITDECKGTSVNLPNPNPNRLPDHGRVQMYVSEPT